MQDGGEANDSLEIEQQLSGRKPALASFDGSDQAQTSSDQL